jgi:hypothetical protein
MTWQLEPTPAWPSVPPPSPPGAPQTHLGGQGGVHIWCTHLSEAARRRASHPATQKTRRRAPRPRSMSPSRPRGPAGATGTGPQGNEPWWARAGWGRCHVHLAPVGTRVRPQAQGGACRSQGGVASQQASGKQVQCMAENAHDSDSGCTCRVAEAKLNPGVCHGAGHGKRHAEPARAGRVPHQWTWDCMCMCMCMGPALASRWVWPRASLCQAGVAHAQACWSQEIGANKCHVGGAPAIRAAGARQ